MRFIAYLGGPSLPDIQPDALCFDLHLDAGTTVYDALIAVMRNAGVGFGDIVALAEGLPEV